MTDTTAALREALDELTESARLLGVTQAKKGFGVYTEADARFETAMHRSIDRHRRAALAARPPAEPEMHQAHVAGAVGVTPGVWVPIETAPMDGEEVIVGFDVATVWIVRSARFVRADEWCPPEPDTVDGWWAYSNSVSQELLDGLYTPTHWMPLPTLPTVATDAGEG